MIRYQMTAYGQAYVTGENAFPQEPEPDYSAGRGLKMLREASDRIIAKQKECEDYKRRQRGIRERPPRTMEEIRLLKAMHRAMVLGSSSEVEKAKRRRAAGDYTFAVEADGTYEVLTEHMNTEFPKHYAEAMDAGLDELIIGDGTGTPLGMLSALEDDD